MTHVNTAEWSHKDSEVAKAAFTKAYKREIDALMQEIRDRASSAETVDDIWRLHDFLSAKRHDIDGKYDDKQPVLLFVLAQLVKEGWLYPDDLDGLAVDKLTKVKALARM